MTYLLAEECRGEFFTGWHLYLRDRPDGSRNDHPYNPWGWLRDEFARAPARRRNDRNSIQFRRSSLHAAPSRLGRLRCAVSGASTGKHA